MLDLRLDKPDGPLLSRVKIPPGSSLSIVNHRAKKVPGEVHDLFVIQGGAEPVEVDWVSFR